MRFVWFLTFYHWSREGFRNGVLARCPIQGIGGHWDEWYRHEASPKDREEIARIGRDEREQRRFLLWIFRCWSRETPWQGNRLIPRFVVGQLANLPPFHTWGAFQRYRTRYGPAGVSAVVLGEQSQGDPGDVRAVEGILLPARVGASGSKIEVEGFTPDGHEVHDANNAAVSLLAGPGFFAFVGLWMAVGRRPGHRWLRFLYGFGWIALGAGLLALWKGPDPGRSLVIVSAFLLGGWVLLSLHALWIVGREICRARRQADRWVESLDRGQLRLRMNGGLQLLGGSAGLAFCLNILLGIYRSEISPARSAWLWRRSLGSLNVKAGSWAATGVITSDGWLRSVVLDPKLRACLQHSRVTQLMTPRQRGARRQAIEQLVGTLPSVLRKPPAGATANGAVQFGYATASRPFAIHRCRHLAEIMMTVGGLISRGQMAINVVALSVSITMVFALPDLWAVLKPPPAPDIMAPGSSSPYQVWVSLDTRTPEYFRVRLESEFWANRVSDVAYRGGYRRPPRAEFNMHRLPDHVSVDEDNGVIWIERRRIFLGREFGVGERVGQYPLSYVSRIQHDE